MARLYTLLIGGGSSAFSMWDLKCPLTEIERDSGLLFKFFSREG